MLDAAIKAQVPRFIPSDYSIDFTKFTSGENRNLDFRREFHKRIDKAYPPPQAKRLFMKALMHLEEYGNSFLYVDQQHVVFFFVAGFVLAALVILVLLPSAR